MTPAAARGRLLVAFVQFGGDECIAVMQRFVLDDFVVQPGQVHACPPELFVLSSDAAECPLENPRTLRRNKKT